MLWLLVGTGLIVWSLIAAALLYLLGDAMYVAICAAVLIIRCWRVCVVKIPVSAWVREWWLCACEARDAMQVKVADGWRTIYWPGVIEDD